MKKFMTVVAALFFLGCATTPNGGSSVGLGPIPPCPYPVNIQPPSPGTPADIAHLLGDWRGVCVRDAQPVRNCRLVVWDVRKGYASIFYGWGPMPDSSYDPNGGWIWLPFAKIRKGDGGKPEIVWKRHDGSDVVFKLTNNGELEWASLWWSHDYLTVLRKSH